MFGIGATKAGTSWLFRYLQGHPECIMPPIKELQYFNLTTPQKYDRRIIEIDELIEDLSCRILLAEPTKERRLKARIKKLHEWQDVLKLHGGGAAAYTDYMLGQANGAKLTADISPAYAMLPFDKIKQMATLVAQTRFVYILRDPLDRLWSNIKMNASRKFKADVDMKAYALQEVDNILAGKPSPSMDRSNYASGLDVLEAAVPKSGRMVLFYEQMFTDEAISKLCGFLGISNHKARLDKRVHQGVTLALDPARCEGLIKMLAPQYRAVEQRFQTLPARWQDNMARVG